MKRVHTLIAGTAGTLALVTAAAFAATPASGFGPCGGAAGFAPMGMMSGVGPGAHGGMWGGMWGGGALSGQNLADLKTLLAITAPQEAAWNAFAGKAAEQAALMLSTREQMWQGAGADTTPQARIAQHIGLMSQHLAGMQAINGAITDLYAVLTPDQRSTADRLFSPVGPGGHGRGRVGFGR